MSCWINADWFVLCSLNYKELDLNEFLYNMKLALKSKKVKKKKREKDFICVFIDLNGGAKRHTIFFY